MTNKLAKQTISTIERSLDNKQSTAINEIIQIIQELASKAFSISVPELSQLIGRDTTITERVISAANTLGFNPGGQPILTISEAIHTVGFEKIRNLSISILLVENAHRRLNSYEQREIAALAVCSGLMAQLLVGKTRSSLEPELAFVCASLRNYGKLLMTTFLIDKYREAKELSKQLEDDDEAFRQVFGLTPLALGQHLLESTNLPAAIMNSIQEVPSRILKQVCHKEEDEILVLAEVCVKACEVAFDEEISPDDFNHNLLKIVEKFGISIPIGLEMINETFIDIDNAMSVFNRALGVQDLSSPGTQKIRARLSGNPLPPRPKPKRKRNALPPPPAEVKALPAEEREAYAETSFTDTIESLSEKIQPGKNVSSKAIFESAARTILDCLHLESCMVFVPEENDPTEFSARYGLGSLFKKVRNRPVVSMKKKDVFTICIARKEDILIQDVNAGKIKAVVPNWISENSETHSFVLLPVATKGKIFAIIFGCMDDKQTITLDEKNHRRLKAIRIQLSRLKELIDERAIKASA